MDTDKYASDAAAGVDKIANKLHTGIRDTYQGAKTAESKLADKADDAVGQVKGRIKDGVKGVRDAVDSGRDALSDSSESILTFTREKPVQALLIAAVSGAVLWTLARAVSSRD